MCLSVVDALRLYCLLARLRCSCGVNVNKYVGPIDGPKCMLSASHAAPGDHGEYADGTDRQTDRRTDAGRLHYAFCLTRPA